MQLEANHKQNNASSLLYVCIFLERYVYSKTLDGCTMDEVSSSGRRAEVERTLHSIQQQQAAAAGV